MASFAERLRLLRTSKSLSQEELAKTFGLTQSIIAHYEANRKQPSSQNIQQIADYFQVSVDYLLGRSDQYNRMDDVMLMPTPKEEHLTFYRKLGELSPESLAILEKQADHLYELEQAIVNRKNAERDSARQKQGGSA